MGISFGFHLALKSILFWNTSEWGDNIISAIFFCWKTSAKRMLKVRPIRSLRGTSFYFMRWNPPYSGNSSDWGNIIQQLHLIPSWKTSAWWVQVIQKKTIVFIFLMTPRIFTKAPSDITLLRQLFYLPVILASGLPDQLSFLNNK